MNMREAVEKTLALHQMVVDRDYDTYIEAGNAESGAGCYLCLVSVRDDCSDCPWLIIEGGDCGDEPNGETYRHNSPQSIIRLNRWLADPRMEKS